VAGIRISFDPYFIFFDPRGLKPASHLKSAIARKTPIITSIKRPHRSFVRMPFYSILIFRLVLHHRAENLLQRVCRALTLQLVEKLLGEYKYDQAVVASIETSVPSTYWRRVYRGLLLQYAIRCDGLFAMLIRVPGRSCLVAKKKKPSMLKEVKL
jgi:hypothetical protein